MSDIDLGEWYGEAFAEFDDKTRQSTSFVDVLRTKCKQLHLDKYESLLSVGPGSGYVDVPLIRDCMPELKLYYGIEPRPDALKDLKQWFDRDIREQIKINLFRGKVENWDGPPDGCQFDLILLLHVLYYLPDRQKLLKQCKKWLKTGGRLIIAHAEESVVFEVGTAMDLTYGSHTYTAHNVVKDLEAAGINYSIEDVYHLDVDLRNCRQPLLNFLGNKILSEEETMAIKAVINKLVPGGFAEKADKIILFSVTG